MPDIAYIIDPRFPGGTSSAVAAELAVAVTRGRVAVHAVSSAMFEGRTVAPQLRQALDRLGLRLIWDAPTVSADLAILHNPSFLRFQKELPCRILARRLVAVSHENFQRPGGFEPYDVGACLAAIHRASLALSKEIAPVSAWNRRTVLDWMRGHALPGPWSVAEDDWFNICDMPFQPPTPRPRDRRGRMSRPGSEKFPDLADMHLCFPKTADANVILGAESLIEAGPQPDHWQLIPFQGIEPPQFFDMIDFMVYFTKPTLRESFGRVLAEGIAAGKVVISDAGNAAAFGDGVVAATPAEVDDIVARMVRDPKAYAQQVKRGQDRLSAYSPAVFARLFDKVLSHTLARRAA